MTMLLGAVIAAVRFAPIAWRGAWGALLLTAAATAAALAAIVGAHRIGPAHLWLLAAFRLSLVARGALWRLALQLGRPGPGGLQVGAVEGRLAAVSALTCVFLAILILLLFVGLLCLAYAASSAGRGFDPANVTTWGKAVDARGRLVVSVGTMAGSGAIVLAAIRISLAEAASVAGGRVQVMSTWGLTRGRLVAIAGGNLLFAIPLAATFLAMQAGIATNAGAMVWSVTCGVVLAGVSLPMHVGLMAYVYGRRAAPRSDR
jgi:hypothetical protein